MLLILNDMRATSLNAKKAAELLLNIAFGKNFKSLDRELTSTEPAFIVPVNDTNDQETIEQFGNVTNTACKSANDEHAKWSPEQLQTLFELSNALIVTYDLLFMRPFVYENIIDLIITSKRLM